MCFALEYIPSEFNSMAEPFLFTNNEIDYGLSIILADSFILME